MFKFDIGESHEYNFDLKDSRVYAWFLFSKILDSVL
jgi:hypothetical protein